MAERIVMRTGEALVEGDKDYLCAEPRVGCETPRRHLPTRRPPRSVRSTRPRDQPGPARRAKRWPSGSSCGPVKPWSRATKTTSVRTHGLVAKLLGGSYPAAG